MCKFIGKSNERIFCKLSKSKILRLYLIVHVAMETTKMSNFTCQSKSFINIFSTCQVSACELQPFSCHDLANDIYSETAKTVFSHLKAWVNSYFPAKMRWVVYNMNCISWSTKKQKIIYTRKMYISENTNIMQIRSRDRTAPQGLKKSLRKNGHTF